MAVKFESSWTILNSMIKKLSCSCQRCGLNMLKCWLWLQWKCDFAKTWWKRFMRLTRTVAPTGWCATPGSSGMPSCRSVSLYLSFTISHHCFQADVGSGLYSKNEYFRAPYLPKYHCFNMLTTVWIKTNFFSGKSSAGPGDGNHHSHWQQIFWSGDKRKWVNQMIKQP